MDRTFGKKNEDRSINLERTPKTTRFLASKTLTFILYDEEEAESSTQSIRIEVSLLGVTPSPIALEFYEICDISSSHVFDPK